MFGIDAAVGGLLGMASAKLQQKWTQQNMAKQQEYYVQNQNHASELEMQNWNAKFAAENARQDYLLTNGKRMELQGLRAAGLNPALAGGSVQDPGTTNPSSGPVQGGAASAPLGADTSGIVDGVMQGLQLKQQGILNNSTIKRNESESNSLDAAAAYQKAQALRIESLLAPEKAKLVAEKDLTEQLREQSKSQSAYLDSQTETENQLRQHKITLMVAESNKFDAETKSILEKLPKELSVLTQQAVELSTRAGANKAQASYYRSQAKLAIKYEGQIDQAIENMVEEKHLTRQEANVARQKVANLIVERKGQVTANNRAEFENEVAQALGVAGAVGGHIVNTIIGPASNLIGLYYFGKGIKR